MPYATSWKIRRKRLEIKGKKGLSQMDKMVKRGITELVTPGVAIGDNVLNYKENNFLAAIHFGKALRRKLPRYFYR